MSRWLSSIGIGAATVDTVLPKTTFRPGETVEATVEMAGGRTAQAIDAVTFALLARVGDDDRVVDQFELTEPFSLAAGESRSVTTAVTIPPWTPLTGEDARVWLETGLDVSWAVDPDDEDDIEVLPGPFVEALFAAIDDLGFEYSGSELREPSWLDDRPTAQAHTFVPLGGAYGADIDALTLVCAPEPDRLRTVVEIDEREPAEAESEVRFDQQEVFHTFDTASDAMVRRQLRTTIDRHTHT